MGVSSVAGNCVIRTFDGCSTAGGFESSISLSWISSISLLLLSFDSLDFVEPSELVDLLLLTSESLLVSKSELSLSESANRS